MYMHISMIAIIGDSATSLASSGVCVCNMSYKLDRNDWVHVSSSLRWPHVIEDKSQCEISCTCWCIYIPIKHFYSSLVSCVYHESHVRAFVAYANQHSVRIGVWFSFARCCNNTLLRDVYCVCATAGRLTLTRIRYRQRIIDWHVCVYV